MKEISFQNDVLPLGNKLYRIALRITLRSEDAEDVVQDTLLKVWEHRSEWEQIGSMEAYATTICRNLALDLTKRAGHQTQQLPDAMPIADTSSAGRMEAQEKLSLVRQLMDSLPETQRTIMQLRDIEGMTYQEIAEAMSLSETQVKVYLHRARTKIKQQIDETEQYGL